MAILNLDDGTYVRMDFITDTCFRLRHSVKDDFIEKSPYARYGIFDYSGNPTEPKVSSKDGKAIFTTESLKLEMDKKNRTFSVSDQKGDVVFQSSKPLRARKTGGFSVEISAEAGEKFYGLGDVDRDSFERRGVEVEMWVKNVRSYVPIPFLMSNRGWAVFSNTTYRHSFDVCKSDPDSLKIWGYYGETDLIFFTGGGFEDLLPQYTDISGRPALLPKFGYGLTFVCNMQADAREMLEDALKFRDREIPCDVIGLEPGWMETYYDKSVDKKFDKDRFWLPEWLKPENDPHHDTFFGALDRMGFKLSLWLCCDYDLSFEEERNADKPFLDEKEPEEADYLPAKDDYEQDVNIGHHPISMDEYTVKDQPFFEHLKKFVDMGASAFKMDGAWQVNTHPDRKWGNGMDDVQMHNLYPLLLSKQMSTGFTEHTKKRSMIYSSGGFAGIQKYAATWAGDTGGGPRPLASMLNHAMSGHVNTSCDMLAFTKEGMHFGFLQSWSQLCSWAYRRHPWYLGKELEGVFKSYARLRYSLLPYIYSTAYTAWLDSLPIMRPLPFAYPGDEKASSIRTQYMLGENLLVSCFTDELYLPEGVWTDYFTGKTYEGPVDMKYDFPEGRGGGLFVKQGAILPTVPDMDNIGDKPMDELIVDVFPHGDSRFTIYDDDGISMEYTKGGYSETTIYCTSASGMISMGSKGRKGSYDGMPESVKTVFKVRCSGPSGLSIDGKPERFDYVDGCAIFEIEDIAKGFSVEIHTNIKDGD